MAQGTTPTNGGSSSIPTTSTSTTQQSLKRTRATMSNALNNVLPIQPRRLFHSDVTHGTTISKNRRAHAKGGAILPLSILSNHENDNRVWVASWMKECDLNDDFEIHVSDSTRMRLALDLVLKEYNDLSHIIEMNATQFKSGVE
ncbi:hypothetical protein PIB30_025200 [Stylosanthes scabra]|uniref:Uncharacterized protein n=1 Tax=Stylosanthes scabra TaxID=79078 RepID=A0ABU6QAV5_9FABA|nr:hypothetical protein [Stylosanthes scabra]